ncbi:MAG: 16S rRNA (adenine(1518)-N(6)/adenine(1519)-N(6))-dimethyltransferase RsmA [Tissierellia bacterium]|nr:16S rRNA (adenine(1518)-N(6)/adenine(1519)-N(6))-dimethyltransferase RsmA [Tissierellia bacterium]
MTERLYMPAYLSRVLEKHGFTFSKALGQNFLIDGNVLRRIADGADLSKEDFVLEIGPGVGTLTEELAIRSEKVVAVELDRRLIPILKETLAAYDNVEVIHQDAMETDFQELIESKGNGLRPKLVANLPYNVGTVLVAKLLEERLPLTSMTVLLQNEVADRMVAEPGTKDYGSLSVLIAYYTKGKKLFKVPRTVFRPKPNVDSAVVHLVRKTHLPEIDEDLLFRLVRAGFNQRRKTILNSLTAEEAGVEKAVLLEVLERLNLSPKLRAENLSLGDFIEITREISGN